MHSRLLIVSSCVGERATKRGTERERGRVGEGDRQSASIYESPMCQCALRIRSVCHNKVAHCFGLQAEVIFGLQRHRGLGGGEGIKNISTRRTKVKVLSRKSQAGRGRRRGRVKADGSCLVISSCTQNGKSTPAAATRREQKRVAKHINNSVTHCGRQWGWHKGQQGRGGEAWCGRG